MCWLLCAPPLELELDDDVGGEGGAFASEVAAWVAMVCGLLPGEEGGGGASPDWSGGPSLVRGDWGEKTGAGGSMMHGDEEKGAFVRCGEPYTQGYAGRRRVSGRLEVKLD
jgi:hypothetical protein